MSKKVYVKPYPKEFREQVVQLGDRSALEVEWLQNGGQLRLRQMRQRSNCVRWCRIHHRQGGQ